jgi:hypothetical protein
MDLPFSKAADRNKDPILDVLKEIIPVDKLVNILEIASGTGQHAQFFSGHFKNVKWITTERFENHWALKEVIKSCGRDNILGPFELEVGKSLFPNIGCEFDFAFMSNLLHILSWEKVEQLMGMIKEYAERKKPLQVLIYGPFNYRGKYTSLGNEKFDDTLKKQSSEMGIRDFEAVLSLMKKNGLSLLEDYDMPQSNRLLCFQNTL